jgi:ABC-type antimicrobial peptide transport system permease subunit
MFGAAALCLAALGVYGVLTLSIAQRTRELGIRLALGAQPRELATGVVRQALGLCALGVAAGAVLALALARFVSGLLYGVSPGDPLTIGSTAAALMVVALVASAIPALRAAKTDPVDALRAES